MELLNEAQLAKNETSQELRVTLENSIATIEGLESRNNDIEQKHSEVLFNIDNLKEGECHVTSNNTSPPEFHPSKSNQYIILLSLCSWLRMIIDRLLLVDDIRLKTLSVEK